MGDTNQVSGRYTHLYVTPRKDTITRLIKIETMLKWICDNQFKLLEKYIDIEQRIETMRNSLEEQRGCIKDSLDYVLANSESR
ncbi:hypothetical protein FOFC_18251 [Fusarium oxysporum]|nr:hypothetical protein FOFC_18251 [Fusarium oxysporum]